MPFCAVDPGAPIISRIKPENGATTADDEALIFAMAICASEPPCLR